MHEVLTNCLYTLTRRFSRTRGPVSELRPDILKASGVDGSGSSGGSDKGNGVNLSDNVGVWWRDRGAW